MTDAEQMHALIIRGDFRRWRTKHMQAHIANFPDNIESICERIERGVEVWKIALEEDESVSILGHWYRAYRGKKISEVRKTRRGKQVIDK